MKSDLVDKLCCPARDCNSAVLLLDARVTETLNYSGEPVEEVREGSLTCPSCHRVYPVEGFVPSFEQLFSPALQEEANFWSKWYSFMWERGYFGLFDLRASMAPLVTEGVDSLDPSTTHNADLGGSHTMLADHPLMKEARRVLDVGCGTGWSSLFLARRGHNVVAFDPSAQNMRLAKSYAISQDVYIEYLGAAVGFLAFKPSSFDAIFALHSIHHVPHLRDEMIVMKEWLREGGIIAVDEHVRTDPVLGAVIEQMHTWARAEVYPHMRSLDSEVLEALPKAGHSSLEDAGSEEVITSLLDNFTIESFSSRYVSLDPFSFVYYLSRGEDQEGYDYAGNVIDRLNRLWLAAFPEGAEYATLVGRKDASGAREPGEAALHAEMVKAGPEGATRPGSSVRSAISLAHEKNSKLQRDVERLSDIVARKNAHIIELESQLSAKNPHILKLEMLVQRQERLLSLLPVRIVLRLYRGRGRHKG